ncbi:MAG TPA: KamA family radical SAM protein [Deltaproteobacteria bacterium]|nr:KamA family radical SAM protein [Deltaproteobacteria bacterium]
MKKELCSNEDQDPLGCRQRSSALPHPHPATPFNPKNHNEKKSDNVRPFIRGLKTQGLRENPRTQDFRYRFYPSVTSNQWNDWRWQLRNRITTLDGLKRIFRFSEDESAAINGEKDSLPVAVTPYYASLLDALDPQQALRRTVIPTMGEHICSPGEAHDPLGEEKDSPAPGLVHRYPDRVLFLVTEFCSTYCRYCTRSRLVGKSWKTGFCPEQWENAIAYIESTPAVRDVLLSGGDPLTLPDDKLEYLLSRLRRIPHVEIIRIGTKIPVVLPHRITVSLARMLGRYNPLWMSIHFTHPDELTSEVQDACARLAGAGIPLGSQTVLLSGINDEVDTMKRLMHGLLRFRVRPYYLYQCDPILGSSHFRTPVEKGLEIIRGLRGHTSGYAVPTYVIDAPEGGGKIPLLPEYVIGRQGDDLLLRNYEGLTYRYHDACKISAGAAPANEERILN